MKKQLEKYYKDGLNRASELRSVGNEVNAKLIEGNVFKNLLIDWYDDLKRRGAITTLHEESVYKAPQLD